MNKKLIIVLAIILVALITLAIFLILPEGKDNKAAIAFKEEYESLNGKTGRNGKVHRKLNISSNNPFIKVSAKKVIEMLNNKESFYLYVGDSLCPWCRSTVEQAIKSAKENGVTKIYYIDFWDDEYNEQLRDVYELVDDEIKLTHEATPEYKMMLALCDDSLNLRNYTVKDKNGDEVEVNNKRFYGPSYFFVKEGKFDKYTDARSSKQTGAFDELTDEIKKDMANNFDELFAEVCDEAC